MNLCGIDGHVLLVQDPLDGRDQSLIPLDERAVAIERQPFRLCAESLYHRNAFRNERPGRQRGSTAPSDAGIT